MSNNNMETITNTAWEHLEYLVAPYRDWEQRDLRQQRPDMLEIIKWLDANPYVALPFHSPTKIQGKLTLEELHKRLGTEEFNDMILMVMDDDEESIKRLMPENPTEFNIKEHYILYHNNSVYNFVFPWDAVRDYALRLQNHLNQNLVIPIPTPNKRNI